MPPVNRLLARLTGARLCFGRPVVANGRTVIPVASVRSAGGGGFGRGKDGDDVGGGGGGVLEARPVGFIEISAEGTRFERIDDGRMALRALAAGSLACSSPGASWRAATAGPRSGAGAARAHRRSRPRRHPPHRRGRLRRGIAQVSQRS